MRTVDPVPAQIAVMDKDTVLGLLKLMGGGNLLKRGAEVNLSVSRWIWSLLAKLPDRGALNSEEIGIVRDLGKKAVLVGVGIREGNKWEQGMQAVEATYEDEEDEEAYVDALDTEDALANVCMEDGDDDDMAYPALPSMEVPVNAVMTQQDSGFAENDSAIYELAQAKARMLGLLHSANGQLQGQLDKNDTVQKPSSSTDAVLESDQLHTKRQAISENPEINQYNSSATVDMILTIAGEIYGQRDLLEFRGAWNV